MISQKSSNFFGGLLELVRESGRISNLGKIITTSECTKIARFPAVAATTSTTAPPQNREILWPQDPLPCDQKSLANGDFLCRELGKLIPIAGVPAISVTAVDIASERRCAILVHSAQHWQDGIPKTKFWIAAECQRFRKGVGGRGLETNSAQNTAKNAPQNCVVLLIRGHRKRGYRKKARICGEGGISSCQPPLSANPFSKPLRIMICVGYSIEALMSRPITHPDVTRVMNFSIPRRSGVGRFVGLYSESPPVSRGEFAVASVSRHPFTEPLFVVDSFPRF